MLWKASNFTESNFSAPTIYGVLLLVLTLSDQLYLSHYLLVYPLQALLSAVAGGPWETLARRRVQHFGHRFEYEVSTGRCPALVFQSASSSLAVTYLFDCIITLGS